ncbi:beta-propeller fold lactonase family protein [Streptomyces cinnamoneus]|uniref:Uncharacterized protein n=1 Tax=Streptomyces cinnamoneus TaxID=53446 RepID=A0A918TJ14_STRCJ|nr:beta-propeller fold lactonase family protein [Streptomyces cinnamoneus]GHC44349.1 hypothetical protein GCM10010507_19170 [Streptomyces cinnamoneus]
MTHGTSLILAVDWAADALATVELTGEGLPGKPEARPVGTNPRAVAAVASGPAAGRLYVCDHASDTVSLLDGHGGAARPLPAPGRPCAVAAGLHAGQVCVAGWAEDIVHLYDADGLGPLPVPTGGGPFAVAGAPGATRVCVACEDPSAPLTVIDIGHPGNPLPLRPEPALPGPVLALAVSPDGGFAYASYRAEGQPGGGRLAVVDLRQDSPGVTGSFAVGAEPLAVLVAPAGDRLCVVNHGSASVSVALLNRTTGTPGPFTELPVGLQPSAAAFAPDGRLLHVVSRVTGAVSAVHLAGPGSDGRLRTGARRDVRLGGVPASVVFGPSGAYSHLTDQATGRLITVRATPAKGAAYGTGSSSRPLSVALTPDGRWACATDSAAKRVAVHDVTRPPATAKELPLPVDAARPWSIATGTPTGKPTFACVTSPATGHLFTLRPKAGGDLGTPGTVTCETTLIGTTAAPHGVAVTPEGTYAFTADAGAGTVSRVDLLGGAAKRKLHTIEKKTVRCEKPYGIAAGDGMLFVTDTEGAAPGEQKGTLSVLQYDGTTWKNVQQVAAADGRFSAPIGVSLFPDRTKGEFLYVANHMSTGIQERVSVLKKNGARWSHHKSIRRDDLTLPHALVLSPDGKTLYVSSTDKGKVAQFSLKDDHSAEFTCWLEVNTKGPNIYVPSWLALSKDGKYLYATDLQGDALYGVKVPATKDTPMEVVRDVTVKRPRGIVCDGDTVIHLVSEGPEKNPKPELVTVILDDANRLKAKSVSSPVPLDNKPYTIAAAGENSPLYVTEYAKGTVAVYGGGITTVPVKKQDDSRPWEAACTSDGRYLYVTDRSAKAPAVHCLALPGLDVTTLPVAPDPRGVACAPDGMRAYVAHRDGTVTLLRRTPEFTGQLRDTTDTEPPRAVAVHPSAPYAYLLRRDGLGPVKLTGSDDGQKLALMAQPAGLALARDGRRAYVVGPDQGGQLLRVATLTDPARPAAGSSVTLTGGIAAAIALHPREPHGYVAGHGTGGAGLLWVVSLAAPDSPVVTATVSGVPPARDLAVRPGNPDHVLLLCPDGQADSALHVLEVPGGPAATVERRAGRLPLPGKPWALALHPSGGYGLVATEDKGVHLVDLTDPARPRMAGSTTEKTTGAVGFRPDGREALHARKGQLHRLALGAPVPVHPWAAGLGTAEHIAVSADGGEVYVTGETSGAVQVVDAPTGTLRCTLPLGTALGGLAPHPVRSCLYAADTGGSAVVEADTVAPVRADERVIGVDVRQVVCTVFSGDQPGASG